MLEARLNEQEASYLALQSQISPHFIYNIISNISACAYNGETHLFIKSHTQIGTEIRPQTLHQFGHVI